MFELDRILNNTGDFIEKMPEETIIKRGRFLIIMKFNYYNKADFNCNTMAVKLFRTLRCIYDVVRYEVFRNDEIPSYYQTGMLWFNDRCVDISLEVNWNRGLGEFLIFIERLLSYDSLVYDISISYWDKKRYRILTRTPLTVNYISQNDLSVIQTLVNYFKLPSLNHEMNEIRKAKRYNFNNHLLVANYIKRFLEEVEAAGDFNGNPIKREENGLRCIR